MADAPERIRVAQDADGFWTCREAVSGSQEYVRADLYAALEAENERMRKMLEWQPIETVPLDTIVDLWCTYAGAPASWGNGRPTGEIVHNRHKSKKYGWFGNQSDDGVPNGDGTDLLPVAWRWPTPDVPLELMERYIAARRAQEGGENG